MKLEQAFDHMYKVFKGEPMKLIEFEDGIQSRFIDDTIRKGRPFKIETRMKDVWTPEMRVVVHEPIEFVTPYYDCQHKAVYAAAVYYVHNCLDAFMEFYDYPEDEAKVIIENGFIDLVDEVQEPKLVD